MIEIIAPLQIVIQHTDVAETETYFTNDAKFSVWSVMLRSINNGGRKAKAIYELTFVHGFAYTKFVIELLRLATNWGFSSTVVIIRFISSDSFLITFLIMFINLPTYLVILANLCITKNVSFFHLVLLFNRF